MHLPLKGIIPPLVTPLNSYFEIDIPGLERLIEHQVSGGVHGLFILGTNGEAPSLSYKLRKEFIKKTCELVNKRIPVLVGITDTSFAGSLEICEYAKGVGADAVVVAPPYYFPVADEEIVDYFESLVPSLSLPFLIYNMPSHTKVHMTVEIVRRAKELGALGIKDSSGDMLYLYSLMKEFKDSPDFSIITGTEIFLPETIMYGGHGAVAGGANIFPKMFVDLYNASVANDLEAISKLREKVMTLYQTIYQVGKHTSRFVKGTKCALSVMGICNDYMAPPLYRFKTKERKQIEKYIEEITIL
jgi:dihydrodipicolinate synthase/N-acetylneuraminate lyase